VGAAVAVGDAALALQQHLKQLLVPCGHPLNQQQPSHYQLPCRLRRCCDSVDRLGPKHITPSRWMAQQQKQQQEQQQSPGIPT
jgi:hypothetical protein